MQELTEEEQQILRRGMRMLARMIAQHHLAVTAAPAARERGDDDEARTGVAGAGESGEAQC